MSSFNKLHKNLQEKMSFESVEEPSSSRSSSIHSLDAHSSTEPKLKKRSTKAFNRSMTTRHKKKRFSQLSVLSIMNILLFASFSLTSVNAEMIPSSNLRTDPSASLPEQSPRRLQDLWVQLGQDIEGNAGDIFGFKIAMNKLGTRVIGGGPQWLDTTDSGVARVYEYDGSSWQQLGNDIDGVNAGDQAGRAVAMNEEGTRVAVGAEGSDDNGTNSGHVRVFELVAGTWTQLGQTLTGSAANLCFGRSLDMNGVGDRVVITRLGGGGVYKFTTTGSGQWEQIGSNTDMTGSHGNFGYDAAMNTEGDRVVFGCPNCNEYGDWAGLAAIFEAKADGSGWTPLGNPIPGFQDQEQFGTAVDFNETGDRLVVGAYRTSDTGQYAGSARIFELTPAGEWEQLGNTINGEAAHDILGLHSVAINDVGDRVLATAEGNDGNGSNSGHARIFQEINGVWTQIGNEILGAAPEDLFGRGTAMNGAGTITAVSSVLNDGNGINAGHIQVYKDTFAPTGTPTRTLTAAPTSTPTIVPASTGSFDIQGSGDLTAVATSGNTIELLVPYNASNREHETTVLSPNCIDPFTGLDASAFTVSTSEDESLGDGFIAFSNTIEIDISKINGTEWFKPLPSGGYGGIVDLCLEAAVFLTLSGVNEKINIVNTNVTLTVEMDASFDVVTLGVTRKDAIEEDVSVDYSQYVEAYQCDSSSPDTPLVAPFPTYNQGDDLTVCVRGTDDDVTEVGSIESLVLSQAGGSSSPFTYVTDGSPVDAEVASVLCNQGSTDVCVVGLKLLGRFFSVEDPGDLTLTGAVGLDFGDGSTTTTRRLGGGHAALAINLDKGNQQEGLRRVESKEEASFEVSIKISGDESSGFLYGAALSSTLVSVIGGGALLLF